MMKKSFNLEAKNNSYMTHYLVGSYKKTEDHDQRLSLVQALNLALEENDSNKFVEILNKSDNSKKIYMTEKPNKFLKKLTKLFSLNKEYINGSKNCTDKFIYESFKN